MSHSFISDPVYRARLNDPSFRTRPVVFQDGNGAERNSRDEDVGTEFYTFIGDRLDDGVGPQRFTMHDADNHETLQLDFDREILVRSRGEEAPEVELVLMTRTMDVRDLVLSFGRTGYIGLERFGPWFTDPTHLLRLRFVDDFGATPLHRTHPRELVSRLGVLARIDGNTVHETDGVAHYGFGDRTGARVDAWFGSDGRGLLVTSEDSVGTEHDDAMFLGVPEDVLDLPDSVPEASRPAHVTGVFVFAGPVAPSEGMLDVAVSRNAEDEDLGLRRLVDPFLSLEDFTPQTVAEAGPWWSDTEVARGFAETGTEQPLPELDPALVERFCRIWGDRGYNDPHGVHYILFEGEDLEDVAQAHDSLMEIIPELGLVRVEAPAGAASGEVWLRTDPRIDAELGNWA